MNSLVAKTIATAKAAIDRAKFCSSPAHIDNSNMTNRKLKKFLMLLTRSRLSAPFALARFRTNLTKKKKYCLYSWSNFRVRI